MGQVPSCSSSSSSSCRSLSAVATVDGHARDASSAADRFDLTLGLPDECLASVFALLGSDDRGSCSLVCRRWHLVDARSRQRLALVARSEIAPSLPPLLRRFGSVSVLSLKCSRKLVSIGDEALARVAASLPSLKKLKLKGCVDVSDDGLRAFSLRRPPALEKVSLAACGFGARGIVSLLCNCPSLRDLTLKRLRKLDAQSTPLSIDAYYDRDDDDAANDANASKKKKKRVDFQLERLCIKDLHNARLFIPLLCSSKPLKSLVVCRLTAIAGSCPDLDTLYLSRVTDCSDEGLSAIAGSCKKLRKLHIDAWTRFGGRTIGEEGIAALAAKCSRLQELVLMGIPIKAPSLGLLASNCPCLERVALCNTDSVGDQEMEAIAAKFGAMKKLCIKNCPITARGIEAVVAGCAGLVKLKVKRCRGIGQESVSHLRGRRGGLVISVDAGSLVFDGAEGGGAGTENEGGGGGDEEGRRRSGRRRDNAAGDGGGGPTGARTSATHVICSSRSALLLRSKFGSRNASRS
ncbi:F-box protein SKIP2 [Eucalyptus grandis]|uniref:F-box protein SKIP2 n=1 Tax=Eucalyptus grandis TaxID=71139 RepID=UPI00192EC854|nr:F-box protein SKIP2 [Eucalyptus grandis]